MDLIDEIFREAQSKGEFSNLPGQGKPLKLDDDPHTPAHLRIAHKLLKDNDYLPDWIEQGKALDHQRKQLLERVERVIQSYRGTLNDANRSSQPEQARQRAESAWQRTQASLRDLFTQYNREVLTYNLKVPTGVTHKTTLNFDREVSLRVR